MSLGGEEDHRGELCRPPSESDQREGEPQCSVLQHDAVSGQHGDHTRVRPGWGRDCRGSDQQHQPNVCYTITTKARADWRPRVEQDLGFRVQYILFHHSDLDPRCIPPALGSSSTISWQTSVVKQSTLLQVLALAFIIMLKLSAKPCEIYRAGDRGLSVFEDFWGFWGLRIFITDSLLIVLWAYKINIFWFIWSVLALKE